MIVKFTFPATWQSAVNGLASNFLQQTPDASGVWGNYTFEINTSLRECDYWVIMGNLDKPEQVKVHKATLFILSEEVEQKIWDQKFIDQFDVLVGSQQKVRHKNYIRDQYVCPWQIKKSFDQLINIENIKKQKELSAIVSDMTWKDGHKKRFAFVNQLKGHFKNNLDWFGRGNIFLNDKWEGLAPYKYSLAIENSNHEYYLTEKIMDCFLAYTMPIYSGCTNIKDYFPEGSYLELNMNSIEESINTIEHAISSDLYTANFHLIQEARNRILYHYQFFPKVTTWLDKIYSMQTFKPAMVKLQPEEFYTKERNVQKAIRIMKKILTNK